MRSEREKKGVLRVLHTKLASYHKNIVQNVGFDDRSQLRATCIEYIPMAFYFYYVFFFKNEFDFVKFCLSILT